MSVRERIVNKSAELFVNYGVNAISTDNISVELGISKRTFYQHFESKQQLIEVIASDEIDWAKGKLQKLKICDYNAVLEVIRICELDMTYRKTHNINFLRDIQKTYPDVWQLYENLKKKYIVPALVENVRQGIRERYYWPDLNEDHTANLWLEISRLNHSEQGVGEEAQQHFIRGLLTQRGISEYLFWQ